MPKQHRNYTFSAPTPLPRLQASDGCMLTDGTRAIIATHGVVPFPIDFILENAHRYEFIEDGTGTVTVKNKKKGISKEQKRENREMEATLPQHPHFGRPCHNGKCIMYAPFKCKTCFLERYCSKQCELEHISKHKDLCNTVVRILARPKGADLLKGFFAILNGAFKRFYEVGNTARCCYTDVERMQAFRQQTLRKKLQRSQEVMFQILGYSSKKSKATAKQYVFSTYDVHWDWAARDARRVMSLILRFTGPAIIRQY